MVTIDFTNHYSEALEMLTQWNANQTLMIRGLSTQTTPVIAFSNRASQTAVAVQARTVTGGYVCDIPNGLLTKPYTIYVDVRVSDGTGIKSIERGRIRVRPTSKPDDYEYVENITLVDITSFIADIDTVKSEFNSIKSMVGGPSTAGTKAAMTDTSKVYVYTGSETGMVNGNWYYHDGTNWVSGGVYNAIAVDTDKTLSVDDMAADAAAAGSIIEVGSTQPSSEANKLWIDPSADEIEIPEMSDLKIVEDKVDNLKSDLNGNTEYENGVLEAINGKIGVRDIVVKKGSTKAEILRSGLRSGVEYTFTLTLASALGKSTFLYVEDINGNNILSTASVGVTADATTRSYSFTPAQNYDIAVFKYTVSDQANSDASVVSFEVVNTNNTLATHGENISDIQLKIPSFLTAFARADMILKNERITHTGTNATIWYTDFVSATNDNLYVMVYKRTGVAGTVAHVAGFRVRYTDSTEKTTFIDSLNEVYHIDIDKTKTVAHYDIVFYKQQTSGTSITNTWDIVVYNESVKKDTSASWNDSTLEHFIRQKRLKGAVYGPDDNVYTATKTNENWQAQSYLTFADIPITPLQEIYAVCSARHGLGKRAGVITFYDTNGDSISTVSLPVSGDEINPDGGFTKYAVAPYGTVKASVQFEGISNAQSAGQSSVIGEDYYVKGCFAFVGERRSTVLNDEWLGAVDDIRKAQGTMLCFGVQTDTHFALLSEEVGENLKEMTKWVGFDFIANLGDITRGYTGGTNNQYETDTNDGMRKYAKEIMRRYTDGVQCPFIYCLGNHENNGAYANAHSTALISSEEMYGQYFKQTFNTGRIVAETGKMYYYMDTIPARIIVLNTNEKTNNAFGVTADQVSWFTNTALNTNKPVLVLSHVPLVDGWSVNTNYDSSFAGIASALEAFKTGGGTVIGCVSGHAHKQEAKEVNNIWYISCTKSYDAIQNGTEANASLVNTAEIFMCDIANGVITTIGLGDADSRRFPPET